MSTLLYCSSCTVTKTFFGFAVTVFFSQTVQHHVRSFVSLLLQIISPVENDVVLEDMFERTTTANSNASIEEEIDEGEDNISGTAFSLRFKELEFCEK